MFSPGAYIPSLDTHSADSKPPYLFLLIHHRWQIKSARALAGFTRNLYKPQLDPQTKASNLQLTSQQLVLSPTPNKHSMEVTVNCVNATETSKWREGDRLRIFPVSLPSAMTCISPSPTIQLSMLEDKMPFLVVQDHLFGCFPHTIRISSLPCEFHQLSYLFPIFPMSQYFFLFLTWALHLGDVKRGTWRELLSKFMIVQ